MRSLWPLASMLVLVASCRQQPPPSPSPEGATPASAAGPSGSPSRAAAPEAPTGEAEGGCFLAPCHGSDLRCEKGQAPMCTMELAPGDACRRFASCSDQAGSCRLAKTAAFESCRACAERCSNVDCEADCAAKAGK